MYIITQNSTHSNIMFLYRSHSASTSVEKGEGEKTKKATKNDIERKACSQKK